MRCVDVNVLIYAHRPEAPDHGRLRDWLERARGDDEPLGICDLVLSGFIRGRDPPACPRSRPARRRRGRTTRGPVERRPGRSGQDPNSRLASRPAEVRLAEVTRAARPSATSPNKYALPWRNRETYRRTLSSGRSIQASTSRNLAAARLGGNRARCRSAANAWSAISKRLRGGSAPSPARGPHQGEPGPGGRRSPWWRGGAAHPD